MNATSDGRPPLKRLSFAYPLPKGSRVEGFKISEVRTVIAVCSPDEGDDLTVSHTLVLKTFVRLPYSGFGDFILPHTASLSVDEIELVIRFLIESHLHDHVTGALGRRNCSAIFAYSIPANCAGKTDLELHVECFWARQGIYFVVVRLMQNGANLGTIGARQLRGDESFHKRAVYPGGTYRRGFGAR